MKNAFVFVPLIFSKSVDVPLAVFRSSAAFLVFCALSSAVYIGNDVHDAPEDRHHPQKRYRPIASGRIAVWHALLWGAVLLAAALVASWWLTPAFGVITIGYLFLNIAYTFRLKHIVLLDVLTVAANYVLRVLAGAVVISVAVTPWLLIASMLLALFLVLGKRRHELVLLGDGAGAHRAILREYSPYFLDQLIGIVTASTVVVYSLYTLDPQIRDRLGTPYLPLTIPFVLYGIFRYLYLVHQKQVGGNPGEALFADRPLLATVALWVLTAGACMYLTR